MFSCANLAGTSNRYFKDWTSDLRIRDLRISFKHSKLCISQAWMKAKTKKRRRRYSFRHFTEILSSERCFDITDICIFFISKTDNSAVKINNNNKLRQV